MPPFCPRNPLEFWERIEKMIVMEVEFHGARVFQGILFLFKKEELIGIKHLESGWA
jgi:hypothetical protein